MKTILGYQNQQAVKYYESLKYIPTNIELFMNSRPDDQGKHKIFCKWYTGQCHNDENFPRKLIGPDESKEKINICTKLIDTNTALALTCCLQFLLPGL